MKFLFNATINYFKAMQFFLIGLALLTTIDFILFVLKIKLPPFIQIVFDVIYNIQSLIYKPDTTIVPVDFTLVVAAVEMLVLAGIIIYILNFIIEFEQIYDRVHKDGVRRYENKFNKQLEKTVQRTEAKANSFAMLFEMEVEKVNDGYEMNDQNFDKNVKIAELGLIFIKHLMQHFEIKFDKTPEGTVIFFKNFNNCNAIFDKIYEFTAQTKENLKQNKIRFRLKTAVCMADEKTAKSTYLNKLKKLINIASPNKIMALGDFISKYKTTGSKAYRMTSLGEYSLGDGTIEVYTLER